MARFKVVLTDFISDQLDPEREVLADIADVEAPDAHHEEELIGRVEDADALIVFHNIRLTGATIERLNNCKAITRCGVGYDNVDHQLARQRNIPVMNVPDYGSEDVADTAIGMMLALTRGIAQYNSVLRDGMESWMYTIAAPLRRLRGQVFGIVGLGRIGTAAAIRAKALGMDVVYYDPYIPDGYDKALGIRRAETLEQLLRQVYVLSLHCPATNETTRLIRAETIRWMPQGSYLINTARGAIVDTGIIPGAVATGHLAGVGLDVLPVEPPPEDDLLVAAWRNPDHAANHRVIINPHAAFYSEEGRIEMRRKAATACRHAILGHSLRNVVN